MPEKCVSSAKLKEKQITSMARALGAKASSLRGGEIVDISNDVLAVHIENFHPSVNRVEALAVGKNASHQGEILGSCRPRVRGKSVVFSNEMGEVMRVTRAGNITFPRK